VTGRGVANAQVGTPPDVSPRMYNTVFALLGLTLMAWLGAVGPHF
jgi:hypothetical protein